MALTPWQEKYLLEEEIEIFLEKEFVFAVNSLFVDIIFLNHFGMLQSVQFYQPNMKMTRNLWFTTSMIIALINSELVTVGHLPKFMSKLARFFVKYAGKTRCEITGSKRYSSDLKQGGLEIPAKVIFQNSNKRIIEEMKKKLDPLVEEYNKKL